MISNQSSPLMALLRQRMQGRSLPGRDIPAPARPSLSNGASAPANPMSGRMPMPQGMAAPVRTPEMFGIGPFGGGVPPAAMPSAPPQGIQMPQRPPETFNMPSPQAQPQGSPLPPQMPGGLNALSLGPNNGNMYGGGAGPGQPTPPPMTGPAANAYGAANAMRPMMASGGHVAGPGTGRSDSIPARLSDGEYVMDAETVSLLGDGSVQAGASKLDRLRANLRRHKGSNLAKGKISPNARDPESYMKGK